MAVTHPTAVRDGIANFVVDQLDEGTPPGSLVFQTSGDVEVATLTLANPAFGASSSGTATAGAIVSDSSATGGTIAKARLKNQAGTDKIICMSLSAALTHTSHRKKPKPRPQPNALRSARAFDI